MAGRSKADRDGQQSRQPQSLSWITCLGCILTTLNVIFLLVWHFNFDGKSSTTTVTPNQSGILAGSSGFVNDLFKDTALSAIGDEHIHSEVVAVGKPVEAHPHVFFGVAQNPQTRGSPQEEASSDSLDSLPCIDDDWCNIPMPTKSSYNFFPPPTDARRWRRAQVQASRGDQVLLKEAVKVFPNHFDFLNGDRSFRPLQPMVDVFVNEREWYNQILSKPRSYPAGAGDMSREAYAASAEGKEHQALMKDQKMIKNHREPTMNQLLGAVPGNYDFRAVNRAPILQLGFPVFNKDRNSFFTGKVIGGVYLSQQRIFEEWDRVKYDIDTPFSAVSVLNENWGFLSTVFPQRVANWSICRCEKIPKVKKLLKEFLDHDKTLMLIVSQHHNQSHPKILTLPRGIPLEWEATAKLVWDAMHYAADNIKKTTLLFASASSWGPRPRIMRCVSDRLSTRVFEGHVDGKKDTYEKVRTLATRRDYYHKLGRSMFGLGLPGLGYDCFRTWELLTMGSIVVTERAVGYDRTFWKLPVLLLEDFSELNENILRTAYLEAIYYAKEFEFERLTQSFWWNVISNVSITKSSQVLLDKFPMEAEIPNFTRPFVRYPCGVTDTCGPGTKRIPKEEC